MFEDALFVTLEATAEMVSETWVAAEEAVELMFDIVCGGDGFLGWDRKLCCDVSDVLLFTRITIAWAWYVSGVICRSLTSG